MSHRVIDIRRNSLPARWAVTWADGTGIMVLCATRSKARKVRAMYVNNRRKAGA